MLASLGEANTAIGVIDVASGSYDELARGVDLVAFSMTSGNEGRTYWQVSEEGRTLLASGTAGGPIDTWALPRFGLASLEATSDLILATEVTEIGAAANEVDLVEVRPGPEGISVVKVGEQHGAQVITATSDGSTVAVGGQSGVAQPLFVTTFGPEPWAREVDHGSPNELAIAPDAQAVMYLETSGTAIWLMSDGSTRETALGDRELSAFDVGPRGEIAYVESDERSRVCRVDA